MGRTESRLVGGLWCHEVLELLPDVVEGTLEADEADAVQRHLAGCDRCSRFGGAYAALVDRVRAAGVPQGPEGLDARLTARLEAALELE